MRKHFFIFMLTYLAVGLSANAYKLETSPNESITPESMLWS